MNRREAIQNMLMILGGTAIIPSSLRAAGQPSIRLKHLEINQEQELLLAEVAETILPATDTPGAKELSLHLFVMKMIDDCHTGEEQAAFAEGLTQLETAAQATFGTAFADGTEKQRIVLLQSINPKSERPEALKAFYKLMKQRTIQGYKVSEYVMTELLPHKMIPDPYDGFYPAIKWGGEV